MITSAKHEFKITWALNWLALYNTSPDCIKIREMEGGTRNWSLIVEINQKQTRPQDEPKPLSEIHIEMKKLIQKHDPELL